MRNTQTRVLKVKVKTLMPNGRGLDIPDRDHMVAVGDKVFKAEAVKFLHERP